MEVALAARRPNTTVSRAIPHAGRSIPFELVRSDRRTLGLTVRSDGSVVARAPRRTRETDVLAWVAGHADWILRKQRDFATREQPRTPPLDYVDGETHLYLGRELRLTIENGEREGVRLAGGRLVVTLKPAAAVSAAVEEPGGQLPLPLTGDGSERVKELLDVWYLRRAKRELPARLQACWASFPSEGRAFPTLRVKRMRSRWGSMSPKGAMSLRADLVGAPVECIDYVVVHELCHLVHPNHSRRFWALVERLVPDWKQRKRRLEDLLGSGRYS